MRYLKPFLYLCVIILLSLQISVFRGDSTQQMKRQKRLEPFSFSRRMQWKCVNFIKIAFTHVNYAYYAVTLELKYTTFLLTDNVHFIYTLGTNKNSRSIPSPPPTVQPVENSTFTELLLKLSPYEKKVVNRFLWQWQDNSIRFSDYFVKMIKGQYEEWEALVTTWNIPLEVPEHQQPYRYQQVEMDQKMSRLHLEYNLKMMNRDVENLYWRHFLQNMNFHFRDFISPSLSYENRTKFHEIKVFLEGQRNESIYYTRAYMLGKLCNTKKRIDAQLDDAYHALNESIHIEKGLYYDTLHPDKKYTITIKPEYKVISREIKEIWVEWPETHIKQNQFNNYKQKCRAILRQTRDLCLYVVRKWHEMKRAQMRRLLYGFSSIQSTIESIRDYLLA